MASSSQTSSMNYAQPMRLCQCEEPEPCILQGSNSVTNPERRYFHCRRRGRRGDCKYWDWVDPELSPYYKDCFLKMKIERDMALEQIIRERKKNEKSKGIGNEEIEESLNPQADDVDEFKQLGNKMLTVEKRIKLLYLNKQRLGLTFEQLFSVKVDLSNEIKKGLGFFEILKWV